MLSITRLSSLLILIYPFNSLARLLHSLPDDIYAFPKYRVTFLNGLPLLNETAERWIREGLRGGEAEFLDHPTPWEEPSPFKHIDSGEGAIVCSQSSSSRLTHTLLSKPAPSQIHLTLHHRADENGPP